MNKTTTRTRWFCGVDMVILTVALWLALSAINVARAEPLVAVQRLPAGGIHPQTAVDSQGRVHLIYFKGDPRHGDLFYSHSDDGGRTFSDPLRVNSQPDSVVIIGTIRGPQIAIGRRDRVHVAWMGSDKAEPKMNGKEAPMLYARMTDAGNGFEPQSNVIQAHPGLDGGGSIAADREGNVYIAWHAPDGGDTEADRRVWITRSKDDGKTFDAETAAIADKTGACGCCGMRIAAAAEGRVYVLYRSATQMVHRDMYLLASKDYGKTFKVVTRDPWEVGYCVMSTAALEPTETHLFAAWETHEQIYVLNDDPRQPKHAPLTVQGQASAQKHPAIAVNGRGEYVVTWAEGTAWNKGGSVAWQIFSRDNTPIAGQSGRADGLSAWNIPAVFANSDNTFKIIY